jgi:hypothetical protein
MCVKPSVGSSAIDVEKLVAIIVARGGRSFGFCGCIYAGTDSRRQATPAMARELDNISVLFEREI